MSMAALIEFKNPFKWTPGTIENAKYNTMPLITNENNPRVKNVIGNEKNWIIGLTIRLRQPKIIVNIIKDPKELIYTLDIKYEIMYKDMALITINSEILLIFLSPFY